MLSLLQEKSLTFLDTIVTTLEQYEDVKQRPQVFSKRCMHQQIEMNGKKKDRDAKKQDDVKESDYMSHEAPAKRFKHLSMELIDIGLHGGQKGLDFIKQTQAYNVTDQFVHYDKRYNEVKENTINFYKFLNDRVYSPIKQNIILFYDQSNHYISVMIKVIKEN
jgi:hypothetical protein